MIEYKWLTKGHIVIFSGDGNITKEDIEKESGILTDFFDKGSHDFVHVIGDDRNLSEFPPLNVLLSAEWIKHNKLGYFIIVGMSDAISRMKSSMAASKNQIRFRLVDTMEEALEILERVDANLPQGFKDEVSQDILTGAHLNKYNNGNTDG